MAWGGFGAHLFAKSRPNVPQTAYWNLGQNIRKRSDYKGLSGGRNRD